MYKHESQPNYGSEKAFISDFHDSIEMFNKQTDLPNVDISSYFTR